MGICNSSLNKNHKVSKPGLFNSQASTRGLTDGHRSADVPDPHSASFFEVPEAVSFDIQPMHSRSSNSIDSALLIEAFEKFPSPVLFIDKTGTQIIFRNKAAQDKIGMRSVEDVFNRCITDKYGERLSLSETSYAGFFTHRAAIENKMLAETDCRVPLLLQPQGASPIHEILTSIRVSKVQDCFVVELVKHDPEVERLEHIINENKAIMHEGRNIRSASMSHMSALSHDLDEIRGAFLAASLAKTSSSTLFTKIEPLIQEEHRHLRLAMICERYVSLIENFFLSAKEEENFDLCQCANDAVDMLNEEQGALSLKKAGLLATTDEYKVYGYKNIMLYSLVNLIRNAIKFTLPKKDSGRTSSNTLEIVVSLTEQNNAFWFSVADSGIGMTEEQRLVCLSRGIKRFNNSTIQGTGTGLSNVVAQLEQIGGAIQVSSIYGQGSTFQFTVPLKLKQRLSRIEWCQETMAVKDYSSLCVLLVDDEMVNLKILNKLLTKLHIPLANIFLAKSANEAFAIYKKQQELNRPIDVVFTDLDLGQGSNGFMLAHSIRQDEAKAVHGTSAAIFIVSGTKCENNNEYIALVNGTILKPCTANHLIKALDTVLEHIKGASKKQTATNSEKQPTAEYCSSPSG